jgi:hypothetical protein
VKTVDEFRIGVTGSRNWKLYGPIERALRFTAFDAHQRGLRPVLGVGDCPTGADWIAAWTWRSWQWEPQVFYAEWDLRVAGACPEREHRKKKRPGDRHHPGLLDTYCPLAGPRRNRRLVGWGLDVLLAFPEGSSRVSGTWQCVRVAEGAGVRVVFPERWQ